ncbi:MAG: U32 family peptidase, partial [Candidatus Methanomethylophilaceae archaeon]|nr:U32 family peptidase [Candidatus Methanomethylophilaceae archaeon]
ESAYVLSNADMYCIDYLKELESLGVTSVKIEGRMRSPAYAHLASKAYSLQLNDPDSEELEPTVKLLKTVFNRGFCHGYLDGVQNLIQSTYPDNRGQFLGKVTVTNKRFPSAGLDVGLKDGLSLFRGSEKVGGFSLTTEGTAVVPFAIPNGDYDLYRTYDPRIDEVKNTFGPTPKFTGSMKRCEKRVDLPRIERPQLPRVELSFYVSGMKVLESVLPYADRIYYDGPDYAAAAEMCASGTKEFVLNLPRFTPEEPDLPEGMAVMVHNPGQYRKYSDGRRVYCGYIMNMFNSAFPLDPYQTTLSVELSRADIRDLCARYPKRVEVMVFGRTELMFSRDPHLKNGSIKDEKGYVFPVYRDRNDYGHILNSSDLMLFDVRKELERYGVNSFGIDVRKRPAQLAALVGKAFRSGSDADVPKIKQMCGGTFNTGHYLRGV